MTVSALPASRLQRVRALLDEHGLDALLVSRHATRRYLSDFAIARGDESTSGYSGTLLVTPDRQILLADTRYLEQAEHEAPDWELRRTRRRLSDELAPLLSEVGATRCGAEATVLAHADWSDLVQRGGVELVPLDESLIRLRTVKDEAEVAALERAAALTDACFAHLVTCVGPGMSERHIVWEIRDRFRLLGAEDLAFEPIVLVGARAAMPHGRPSDAAVRHGEMLLLDFGCQVDGYRSDMTRMLCCGEPNARQRELHQLVLEAQQAAYAALRPGISGIELDGVARAVIGRAGLAEAFSHGLGHGIGLETHEAPMLLTDDQPLEPGMVFTLEPGVYLPGEIGVRIEDDVVLTEEGPRRLTSAPHELIVI